MTQTSQLSESVILITGGTGSVGCEVVRQALATGWRVVFQGRSTQSVRALLQELSPSYGEQQLASVVADIKQAGGVEQLVQSALACFGRLDAVVDCLVTGPEGDGITGLFENTSPDQYLPFAEHCIVYLQRLLHAVLPPLTEHSGCFVTFVSDAGLFPAAGQSLVGAARAAAISFIKNIAVEISHQGVRVHCLSLSYIKESRIYQRIAASNPERLDKAVKRAGLGLPTPADIAPMALFLCGDGARHITGQVISINGGLNV